jgi:uncharacterized protein YbgA (DUF1722 family)
MGISQGRYEVVAEPLIGKELGTAIRDFFDKVGTNEALIYFSGHGVQVADVMGNQSGYLVTSDCTTDTVSIKGLPLEGLNRLILNAKCSSLTVLLDCCHGGSSLEDSQIESALTAMLASNRNYFLATACRNHEKAYEGEDYSLFTAAVIKALKSPGIIKTADLRSIVARELDGSGQEPFFWGSEKITLTYSSGEKGELDKPDQRQDGLEKLRPDYDILDAAFFAVVADKVANNQARTQILKLRAANWSMLFQKNYVERDQQGDALAQALRLSHDQGISLMLIRGEPGAGKTALLRWLAYELFSQGKRVFHKKSQSQFGWLEQLREFSEESGGENFYVIADDLFRDDSILEELQQNEFLFPLTLIGTTRQNEDRHSELQGVEYETVCLDLAKPSAAEKERVLALPEVKAHLIGKSTAERQQLMDSPIMLVLMLQLSEGKPFDVLLWDIVKDLPNTDDQPLYQAFGVLCCFFQYDIIVPIEVLQLCLPPSDCLEQSILSGLEGLIDTVIYRGYEGFTSVHELIAKTVMSLCFRPDKKQNRPYFWIDRPPLLERHLRAIVPNLNALQTLQKWWILDSLEKLARNQEAALVSKILQEYSTQIEAIQQQNTVSEWSTWAMIYAAIGWTEAQLCCVRSILLTQPISQDDWEYWLSHIEKLGSREQQQAAIIHTQTWLDKHPDNRRIRVKHLALVERLGSREQQQTAIIQIQTWLNHYPDDYHVRANYLGSIERIGRREQQQTAIVQTQLWLETNTNHDGWVRTKYLTLVERLGSREQQQTAIVQTQTWLDTHPDNGDVYVKYLKLVEQRGSREQQQTAIVQTQTWLDTHPDNGNVRMQYLALVCKTYDQAVTKNIIHEQWQWIIQQQQIDQNLWNVFLPSIYHHPSPELYPTVINLALRQYPDNTSIICQTFGYFRDYLDHETCHKLATHLSQSQLPIDKWQNLIHAANFFRDYNEFYIAEDIYCRTISSTKKKVQQFSALRKTIDFANLSYAQFLLVIEPPQTDQALQKLDDILGRNPRHSFAHLLTAQAYQAKGSSFHIKAKHHFEKALEFDREKKGFFSYKFGCFYRYAVGDITNAHKYFQQSLTQKLNLPASIELAELEAKDDNYKRAKTLLQDGLSLIPITRPEKEEREKFHDRIAALAVLLDIPEAAKPYTPALR